MRRIVAHSLKTLNIPRRKVGRKLPSVLLAPGRFAGKFQCGRGCDDIADRSKNSARLSKACPHEAFLSSAFPPAFS